MTYIINSRNDTVISGTGNGDLINNGYFNVTIYAGDGDDTVDNAGSYVKINAEAGNDSIINGNSSNATTGSNAIINAGSGNDFIDNRGFNVSILAGSGNDSIHNIADDVSIDADNGNDSINNSGSDVKITSGDGKNIINNSGSDVIISSSDDNDSIFNRGSYVSINSGNGNDYIHNYDLFGLGGSKGHDASIDAGNGNDSIFNSSSDVIINSSDGNDSIRNAGSNVTIDTGSGDDYISNGVNGHNVTINPSRGNDTIELNSKYRSDSIIFYSSGDGNDVIKNFSESDTISIIEGNISNAKLDGDDVVIKIGDGSIRLAESKDTEVTIIDPQGKEIKFTNVYQGINNDDSNGGDDTNIASEGYTTINNQGELMNTKSNTTINGTANSDKIYNGGKNVLINGLDGNDFINDIILDASSGQYKSYQGENVTINGGKGNDDIYANSSDYVQYAAGDGDDTVRNYSGEKIILTSGKFKGAYLDSNDVIVKMGNGSITLEKAKSHPVTIIDSNNRTITFTLDSSKKSFELSYFESTIGSNKTIIATNHDGWYAGEKITANNGYALIEEGDSVTTDSDGNITLIKISDKTHTITTPIGKTTVKVGQSNAVPVMVTVQAPDGTNIANIFGAANIYWNDEGRVVIEASDKNQAISVVAFADNVDIIGSDKKDSIISKGRSANIDSGLGNDSIQNDGPSATIFGGFDNDTISGNIGIIKLSNTVKKAAPSGSNELITTTSNNLITLTDASSKQITVDSSSGQLVFSGNYAGDPKYWLAEAKAIYSTAEGNLTEKIQSDLESAAIEANGVSINELNAFKSQFKPTGSVKIDDIPASVFSAIAGKIKTAIENSQTGFKLNTLVTDAYILVSQLGLSKISVTDSGDSYTINFNSFIAGGTGSATMDITKNGSKWTSLTWEDDKNHQQQALNNFLQSLSDLNEEAWWNVVKGAIQDVTGSKKVADYAIYAKDIVKSLLSEDGKSTGGAILTAIKSVASNDGADWLKNFIEQKFSHGKQIINALSVIKEMATTYNKISSYVSST